MLGSLASGLFEGVSPSKGACTPVLLNGRAGVEKLLFPVKLGPLSALMITGLCGCGYVPVNSARDRTPPLSVQAAPYKVADPAIVAATLAGAREELSQSGLLAPTGRFPQLWVEVVRMDQAGTGIAAVEPNPGAAAIPLARGVRVAITARAWIVEAVGATPAFDTGDVRRTEAVGTAADIRADAMRRDAAARAAARNLGHTLVRSVLGDPAAPDEPL